MASTFLDLSSVKGMDSPQTHGANDSTLSGISTGFVDHNNNQHHPNNTNNNNPGSFSARSASSSSRGGSTQASPRGYGSNNTHNNIMTLPAVSAAGGNFGSTTPTTTATTPTTSTTTTVHAHIGELPREGSEQGEDKLGGVGIVFVEGVATGRIGVLTLTPNGPAERQGVVRVGDLLSAVDGRSVEGMPLVQIRKLVIGRPFTNCSLTLDRPATRTSYTVSLERESSLDSKKRVAALQQELDRASHDNAALSSSLNQAREERRALEAEIMRLQQVAASATAASNFHHHQQQQQHQQHQHQHHIIESSHWTHDQQVVDALERSSTSSSFAALLSPATLGAAGGGGGGGGNNSANSSFHGSMNNTINNNNSNNNSTLVGGAAGTLSAEVELMLQRERLRATGAQDEANRLGMLVDQLKQDLDTQRRHLREEAQEEAHRQREEWRKQFHQRDCLLSDLNSELTRERERATLAEQETNRIGAMLDDRRVEMEVVQARLLERESEIRALQREKDSAVSEMQRMQEAASRDDSARQDVSAALRAERQRATAAEAKVSNASRAVERIQTDMERLTQEHDETVASLHRTIEDVRSELELTREEVRHLQQEVDRAEQRARNLETAASDRSESTQWERQARAALTELEREKRSSANVKAELERVQREFGHVQSQLAQSQAELRRWGDTQSKDMVEVSALQRELATARAEVGTLEHEIGRLQQLRQQETEAREVFATDLQRDATASIAELENRLRESESDCALAEARCEATEKKLSVEAERRASAEMRARAARERITELEDALRSANQERAVFCGDSQSLDVALRRHEEALMVADSKLRDSEAAHRSKDETIGRLQEEIRRLVAAKDAADREIHKATGIMSQLTSSAQDLALANEDLKDVAGGRMRAEVELAQTAERLRRSEQQLAGALTEIRGLENALRVSDEALRGADKEVGILKATLAEMQKDGSWRESRMEAVRVETAQREEHIRRKVEEVEAVHRLAMDAVEKRERALVAQLNALRESEANARAHIKDMENRVVIARDETLRVQDALKRQIDEMRVQLDQERRGANEHARVAIATLEEEIARATETMRVEIRRRENEERLSQSLSAELNTTSMQLHASNQQLASTSQQLSALAQQSQASTQQINNLQQQLHSQSQHTARAMDEITSLNQQIASLAQQLDMTKAELARERTLRAEQAHRHMDDNQRVVVAATAQIAHMERGYREVLETEKRAMMSGSVRGLPPIRTMPVDPMSRSFDMGGGSVMGGSVMGVSGGSDSQRGMDLSRTFDAGAGVGGMSDLNASSYGRRGGGVGGLPIGASPLVPGPPFTPATDRWMQNRR